MLWRSRCAKRPERPSSAIAVEVTASAARAVVALVAPASAVAAAAAGAISLVDDDAAQHGSAQTDTDVATEVAPATAPCEAATTATSTKPAAAAAALRRHVTRLDVDGGCRRGCGAGLVGRGTDGSHNESKARRCKRNSKLHRADPSLLIPPPCHHRLARSSRRRSATDTMRGINCRAASKESRFHTIRARAWNEAN